MARAVAALMPESGRGRTTSECALDGWWAIQVALASLDRLEVRGRDSAGLHVLVAGSTGSTWPTRSVAGPDRRARRRPAVRVRGGAHPGRAAEFRLQGGGRDRRARRQRRRRSRRRSSADALLARALAAPGARATVLGHTRWASVGIISEANAHPLNSEEVGRGRRALRDRGPQRRRRQLRRPAAGRGPGLAAGDHDRRQGHPGAGLPPAWPRGSAWTRRSGPRSPASRARSPSPRRAAGRARRAAPGPVGSRPVALRRPGRGRLRGGQRALRPGRGDRAATCAWTARPPRARSSSLRPGRRRDPGRDDAGSATTAAACPLERARGASRPRSPRGTSTAAAFATSCSRRSPRRPASFRKTLRGRIVAGADGRLAVRVGDDTLPPALAARLAAGAHPPGARDRPGHRRGRRPGRRRGHRPAACRDRGGRRPCPPPSCPASG